MAAGEAELRERPSASAPEGDSSLSTDHSQGPGCCRVMQGVSDICLLCLLEDRCLRKEPETRDDDLREAMYRKGNGGVNF